MRKTRRRRRRLEVGSELIVTSMVDMFSLLLTFLLNFVDPNDPASLGVSLPASTSREAAGGGLSVTVTPSGVTVGGDDVLTLEPGPEGLRIPAAGHDAAGRIPALEQALRSTLEGVVVQGGPGAAADDETHTISLHCDRSVPFTVVGEVLDAARNAGFERYRFAVMGTPEAPRPAPTPPAPVNPP